MRRINSSSLYCDHPSYFLRYSMNKHMWRWNRYHTNWSRIIVWNCKMPVSAQLLCSPSPQDQLQHAPPDFPTHHGPMNITSAVIVQYQTARKHGQFRWFHSISLTSWTNWKRVRRAWPLCALCSHWWSQDSDGHKISGREKPRTLARDFMSHVCPSLRISSETRIRLFGSNWGPNENGCLILVGYHSTFLGVCPGSAFTLCFCAIWVGVWWK
jgi:hypothetical protein